MTIQHAKSDPQQNLLVMCVLSLAVGAIGGLGAWVFRLLIGMFHNLFFLGKFQLAYDANAHTLENPWGPWVIAVPMIGAVIVAWLVKTFAPEAKGHGVPEVIDAIHYGRGNIRPVVAAVKSLASAVCIGSGGSVGREGPIIQIGSAFGSTLGQIMRLPTRQRITLVAAGAASGIAATFNAPLGGIVFAIELLLISVNVRTLLPVATATVTATYIGRALLGTHPAFDIEPLRITDFHLESPWGLLLFVPFGLVMGLASIVFVKGMYWTEDRFDAMPGGAYTRHVFGMTIVGSLLFAMFQWQGKYYVAGIGYGTIVDVLSGALTNPAFLLLLCALKLVATFLTLGSGGSGGIFSPAMYVGATLGAACGLAIKTALPEAQVDTLAFALAGMAAMIGASTGAMVTAAVMLHEMTDDNNVMLPVITTMILACAVRKHFSPGSIYTIKLLRRGHVVPEGLQAALDDARNVSHVMSGSFSVIEAASPLTASPTIATIVVHGGEVQRLVAPGEAPVNRGAEAPGDLVILAPDEPLVDALRKMKLAKTACAVVSSRPDSARVEDVLGVLSVQEISSYRTELAELFS
ncbi:H(+)/Cl(-) exchange transporter ClcA [Pirellulimonas nuda]|uniref:H(+)/Cl(-) exchange transporter ClcA n=1 Tax=Pirellulimonas nuda TaxID=2528009 RepID=A0A518D8X4_9BACT|nr:chloride channel protein [Pirellulimonas nuda]QDU87900.1 H(+)/Cl(-) exchange transporter ClcA [Pirellulimonas nuda]